MTLPEVEPIIAIARQAGEKIMEVYTSDDFEVETKTDGDFESPLTRADTAASDIIVKGLAEESELPIVNEENELSHTISADTYWLVDPLDGTKEFIKRNDEFTVNIALIAGGEPVLGVVYAPALNVLYWNQDHKAYKQVDGAERQQISTREPDTGNLVAVVSRSHINDETQNWLDKHEVATTRPSGSSLKICLVAEGEADYYPRLAPTMIWDTAAADAVLRAAGGETINADTTRSLNYNLKRLKNPSFICRAK